MLALVVLEILVLEFFVFEILMLWALVLEFFVFKSFVHWLRTREISLHRRALAHHVRTAVALVEGEDAYHAKGQQGVEPSFVTMDEQRSQYEVMNEEEEQEDGQLAPYEEHLLPIELGSRVVHHSDVEGQQGRCEE